MSFPKYPEYKKSNLDYLGTVPGHWRLKRVKFLLAETYDSIKIGPFGSQLTSDMLVAEGAKVYGQENVISKNFSRGARFITEEKRAELNVYSVLAGDILITMMGTSGRCAIVPIGSADGVMDSHLLRIRLSAEVIPEFFQRLIDEADYVAHQVATLGKGSIMHGLNSGIVKQLELAIPPVEEQTAIATFFDRETGKIDALIAEQERLLALLTEKRQATISHAVTKGLNPDVPMKDSGVVWLGEVPEYWEVVTFQRCVYVAEGQVDPEKQPYRSMLLIAPNHVESGTGRLLYTETAEQQSAESGKYLCTKGDVIYSKIRPALRKVCLAPDDCLCSADMYPLRGSKNLINQFLMWFMLSEPFSALAVLESGRVAMPKINRESLKEVWISLPPKHEQLAITSFLDTETAKIDALKSESERAIALLKERRSALIAAAVTGQIDVRQA